MRRADYYTKTYRSEETLARHAARLRSIGGIYNNAYFDIVALFNNCLLGREINRKGILSRVYISSDSEESPAEVSYDPLILKIDEEVERLAELGDPISRHVYAHEIGHISLHDNDSKSFSNDPSLNIAFAENEYSTEWQANTFAGHFLLPDNIISAFHCDVRLLAERCAVPTELVNDRLASFEKSHRKAKLYSGDACPQCCNFTLRYVGLKQKCDTCDREK